MNEEALELSAKFLSIDPIESPETSRSASLHFLMDSDSELDSQEYKEMFKKMCDDYESLRLRGQNEGLSENDFMERLGKPSSCFVANPDLFLEVHELWCDDFRRASMYRVDPFQKALVLLRSHLNPIIPEDFKKRKQLRREILGPLKSPQVIFGAAPFEIAISPKHEKTSLKKQQG